MFKKLKQKINEEQSPQRNASPLQAQQAGPGERRSSHAPSFQPDGAPSPSDREALAGMIAEPAFLSEYTIFALDHSKRPKTAQVASVGPSRAPSRSPRGSINGDGSASPQPPRREEPPQTLAQKLQLKVPSVESLIRSGASRAEGLFRSPSRESLGRSASRESLTPAPGEGEPPGTPGYDPPSDVDSEAEDSPGSAEALSREQLLHRLRRVERSLGNYRGKYSELVTAFRTVQRDKEKSQAVLSQSQDKALRRIGELREELQMDQLAKKHLQEEFDATLEEKDQIITVLQTQVALMKKRLKGVDELTVPSEDEVSVPEDAANTASGAPQTPSKDKDAEGVPTEEEGSGDPARLTEALQKRVKRQENLLLKCKELLHTHKERSAQLGSENETLQEQLQERLQELEKMKELHTTEKTKLITQLRDAKNLIEQLEQDKGMVIAETKRQMHETLEMKEDEIAQLRTRIQQITSQKEELQEQKEKNEKSAFEELERALGMAQRAEEARKQLQVQLEEQVKEVEREGEEERKSLQQELSRVKQEVVSIMKKSSEETVANMEKQHNELLATKEHELTSRINQALEQCREEFSQAAKEREQQSSLALEDAELQKTALKTEAENKVKEAQLELEAARTRILELESMVEKSSEDGSVQSNDFSNQMKELKAKHKEQMSTLKQKQRAQLEKHTDTLTQQHNAALETLKQNHSLEMETILKDKELQFQAHIEDMNQKTLEKLDMKQTELEVLASELTEALRVKRLLEEKLAALDGSVSLTQKAMEQRLQDEVAKHNAEMANIMQQHEQSLGGMEKTLKEELNNLKMVLEEKQRELEEHILVEKTLKEKSEAALQDLNVKSSEMEELSRSLSQAQSAKNHLEDSNAQLSNITKDLLQCKKQLKQLEHQLEMTQADFKEKDELLQQKLKELEEKEQQLQQAREEAKLHLEEVTTRQEEEQRLRKELDEEKAAHENKIASTVKEMDGKLKTQETKMDKIKQKAKEMQEKFKKRLQENEESMKKELAKKEDELQQKEQQVRDKILDMAQKSSHGLSSAMSELQTNHQEELEKLRKAHKNEVEDLEHHWREKLRQQEEDVAEKHLHVLQEKALELEDTSQQLSTSREEKDQALLEINKFKEELAIRETTVQKLQVELKEAAAKVDGLSQSEALLKEQIESAERNLNQALNERNGLQDQLSRAEEESRANLKALSEKFDATEGTLKALESSKSKHGEDLERKLEESALQLQAKEGDFQKQFMVITNQMEHYCQEVQSKVESGTTDLYERVEFRVTGLKDRVMCNQKRIEKLNTFILTKLDTICTLEEKLHKQTEENMNLCSSIEQLTAQLGVQAEHIEALTNERDGLLKEAESHSQSISENVLRVQQLSEENKTISENMSANVLHISNLESIIDTLKSQLAGSTMEKEEAINLLNQRCKEESQQIVANMRESIERLEQEKMSAVEQADALRNSLSEFKNKAESRFTQNHHTVVSLQDRLQDLEREILEKNEALQRMTANIDNQSISKSEMDQALSEKEQRVSALASELESCNGRLCELQDQLALKTKECEQLSADLKQQLSIRESEKREFSEQLQQTQEQFTQNGHLFQETEDKLRLLEKENHTCKLELEAQRVEFEKMSSEILKSKEESLKDTEERLSAESAKKMAELKKKAEQKIGQIKKQLTSQIEEKEQIVQSLKSSLEKINEKEAGNKRHIETLEEQGRTLEEKLGKLQEDHKKRLEQTQSDQRLEKEKSLEELRRDYEEKMLLLQRDETAALDAKADETHAKLEELGGKLSEAEEQNRNLVAEMGHLKEELLEREARLDRQQVSTASMEEQTLVEQEDVVRMEQSSTVHAPRPEKVDQRDEDGESLESLKEKLTEVKNEKLKIQKDFTRLQKDFRSLRREHEQDLDHLKKELAEENEKNLKLELEDLEMKQNSALKQLMRDFNTQLALKEREIELTVKETIGKAQSVEAEIISSHREEVSQLHQLMAQKDDDLQRTVQKYEQVLQSREEEMGGRVWQVQKELEDLQARAGGDSEMGVEELQAQLAERNTLLSEARLKEQEFVDRIHSLEDTMRCLHKKAVVTHLGSPCKDPAYSSSDALSEPTEFEYLRKVLFEYMMGRETKTMAKVLTSVLKFPPDQVQSVLDKEESKSLPWLR